MDRISGVVADAERVVATGHRVDGGGHIARLPRTEAEPLTIVFASPLRVEFSQGIHKTAGRAAAGDPRRLQTTTAPEEHGAWGPTRARELASRAIAPLPLCRPSSHGLETAVTVIVSWVWAVTSDPTGRSSGWRRADSRLLRRLLGLTGKACVARRRPRIAGVT